MFGFVLAAGCAIGLFFLSRGPKGHRGRTMRGYLTRVFSRLETTPGQEQVIRDACVRLRRSAQALSTDVRGSRGELSEVFAQAEFDETRIEQWLSDRENSFSQVKPEVLASLRDIHGVLDQEQRRKLARWVEMGQSRLFPFGGHNGRWGHVC